MAAEASGFNVDILTSITHFMLKHVTTRRHILQLGQLPLQNQATPTARCTLGVGFFVYFVEWSSVERRKGETRAVEEQGISFQR